MKKLSVTAVIIMIMMTSCATTQKEIKPSKTLNDEWGRWLAGEWEGPFESTGGRGKNQMEIELCLNGRFLITKYQDPTPETSIERIERLKKTKGASIGNMIQDSIYKGIEFRTIDPNSGQVVGEWFDNWRPVLHGWSKREGNKEIMRWEWPERRILIVRTIEKIDDDKFIMMGQWSLLDGSVLIDDKTEMTRKKPAAEN